MDIVRDILLASGGPLHIKEIILKAQMVHGVQLHRESLVSALTKKVLWLDQTREDWSGDYRLFSQAHWETLASFAAVLRKAVQIHGGADKRLYVGQDNTIPASG